MPHHLLPGSTKIRAVRDHELPSSEEVVRLRRKSSPIANLELVKRLSLAHQQRVDNDHCLRFE